MPRRIDGSPRNQVRVRVGEAYPDGYAAELVFGPSTNLAAVVVMDDPAAMRQLAEDLAADADELDRLRGA